MDAQLKKVGRKNVHEESATNIYTSRIAKHFGYFATNRGDNILKDVFFFGQGAKYLYRTNKNVERIRSLDTAKIFVQCHLLTFPKKFSHRQ